MSSGASWVGDGGRHPARLCSRPGCGTPAAATLRFQPTRREAWLVDLDRDAARTEGDLCARHAAGLVLPRGWQLHSDLSTDLRAARQPLGDAASPGPARRRVKGASIAGARRRRPARRPVDSMQLPGMGAPAERPHEAAVAWTPAAPAHATPAHATPNGAPSAGARPADPSAAATGEPAAELAEALDAQTPLLRRAFSNVRLPDRDS